ncbi:MAG: hypothetical protein R3B84_03555 [Zavarzinella sp.]
MKLHASLFFVLLTCFTALTPTAGLADEKIRIQVMSVLACSRKAPSDDRMKELAKVLQKTYPELTCVDLAQTATATIKVGETASLALIDGLEMKITITSVENNVIILKIHPPKVEQITYKSSCGCYFPIVTPYQNKQGRRLIVAIMVKQCDSAPPK